MSRSKEARAAAMRLAIQRLNEATDLLTPHAADDRVLFAAAEISGSVATVLAAQLEAGVELFAPITLDSPVPVVHEMRFETTSSARGLLDPPFDASDYERPSHHVSCLCADCRAEREAAGVRG